MINILYDNIKNTTRVELSSFNIFNNHQLPLTVEFKNYVNDTLAWSHKLYEGCWIEWSGGEAKYNLIIKNAQEHQILEWNFKVEEHGNQVEKILYYYIKNSTNRTKSIIIGSHDGSFGGWVFPVMDDICDIVMVDGGLNQLKKAKSNYSHLTNCKFINEIITNDGKNVIWYEGGEGYTDTIDKKVISKFLKEDEIKSYTRTSVSINDIFKQNDENFNWLYLDAEGADADLILSLKYYPDLIIFEPDHINNDKHVELIDWFHINNYKIFKEDDYIAIKNKNIEIEKK